MGLGLLRQFGGKRAAGRPALGVDCDRSRLRRRLGRCLVGFQIFKPQFELLDVGVQFSGADRSACV